MSVIVGRVEGTEKLMLFPQLVVVFTIYVYPVVLSHPIEMDDPSFS